MTKKVYAIPVQWEMEAVVNISADSLDEALTIFHSEETLPREHYYISNTLEVQPWFARQHKDEISPQNQNH